MIAKSIEAMSADPIWPDCPYRVRLATPDELRKPLTDSVLASIGYGAVDSSSDSRRCWLPLPLLAGARAGEIWESLLPVQHGREGGVGFAENGAVMMLQMSVPEEKLTDLESASENLYSEMLRFTAARGYPHLLRVWNYLSRINQGAGDAERYRHFCAGRYSALSGEAGFERHLPAATAIGTADGGLTILALAARQPGVQIENPRQLSAYRYPPVYGRRSPSFARATLAPWADGAQLLVSGTASIVGHATAHAGDAPAQLRQTSANLDALLNQPGLKHLAFVPEQFTLYLRHADDLAALQPLLPEYFGEAPLRVLGGDICRRELLLEVEASYRQAPVARR